MKTQIKNLISLAVLCFFLASCGPEDPNQGCSLEAFNGKSYKGFIRLCNALPGQQQDFEGTAAMSINDSLITFNIISVDPNNNFTHTIIVKDDCRFVDDEYLHTLYEYQSNSNIGFLGLDGISLYLELRIDPCSNTSFFSGLIEE
jgi:hypothetical protein